jgi:hypothetical protein
VIIIEDRFLRTVVKLRLNGRGAVTSAHRIDLADFRPASDPDLRLGTTVYIVDPTSTNITEGSPTNVAARTVVVSSPNSSHFKDFEKRRPSPHPLFMEPWTLYELLAARVHIDPSVPQETVVERWMAQGGNPRHVLCEKSDFAKAQRRTESKIKTLPDVVLENLITAPESIRLEEGDESAPNSAVVAYTSVHPFTEPCGVFISDSVLRAVAHMFYSRVFHWINNARPSDCRGTASDAFQAIACEVLAGKCQFQVAALRMGELMVPPCPVSPHPHTPLGVSFGRAGVPACCSLWLHRVPCSVVCFSRRKRCPWWCPCWCWCWCWCPQLARYVPVPDPARSTFRCVCVFLR